METITRKKGFSKAVKDRVLALQKHGLMIDGVKSETVISDKNLAQVIGVSRTCIIQWRKAGIINGKKILNQIHSFNIQEVANDLARFIK